MAKQTLKQLTDSIQSLRGDKDNARVENQKINNAQGLNIATPQEKKIDGRRNNRGIPGKAGRPPGGVALQKRILKQMLAEHFAEKIQVRMRDPKTGKEVLVEKHRVIIEAERLFNFGAKNYQAIDLWFNRAVGKAPQPVVGDEEEDPIQINHISDRTLDTAYGDDDEG